MQYCIEPIFKSVYSALLSLFVSYVYISYLRIVRLGVVAVLIAPGCLNFLLKSN